MPLAIFDLDNTLLAGDSDHLWGQFLVDEGLVDGPDFARTNDAFYQDYQQGTLDIDAFLRFALHPLRAHPPALLESLRARFVQERVAPLMLPAAQALIDTHRAAGDTLLIITASNTFITAPTAALFGIPNLIATDPELRDGRFTGAIAGTPSFRAGKVTRLEAWLAAQGETLAGSSFYSDSHNDLPLLERVDRPVAVDPDPQLHQVAVERGWLILSLRG
ncbi:MAG TPA: HAD family hydrolase [Lamprocystis sp. (in: g-proteobacteria)]|nr:HAD family hydrolase [Lamprocystis sp. (in: g-proteobacteria)]